MWKKCKVFVSLLLTAALFIPQAGTAPTAQAAAIGDTVVANGFDMETDGWFKRGSETVVQTSETAQSGTGSLKTTGRTANWNGPGTYADTLVKGAAYEFSVYAKLLDNTPGDATIQLTVNQQGLPANDPETYRAINSQKVSAADWVEIKGSFTLDPRATRYQLYVESPDNATVSYYIDTFRVKLISLPSTDPETPATGTVVLDYNFEDGQGNWVRRFGAGGIEVSSADNRTPGGSYSLLTTASGQYDGPIADVLGKMHRNYEYNLSAWVKMAPGEDPTRLRLSVQSGESTYTNVSPNVTVNDSAWVQLAGKFALRNTPSVLKAYVETADDNGEPRSFYMDDFSLTYVGSIEGTMPIETNIDSLKDLYASYFEIGAAVEPDRFSGTADQLLKKHYNSIVAENSMKPASLNPSDGAYNYSGADAIAKYARDNHMRLRFHTLLWHQQGADWMLKDAEGNWLEPNEANKRLVLDRLRTYITTVVAKYADVADYYDVVNEVIDESRPDGMRDSQWYRIAGTDFIKTAFEAARAADPTAKLYINDYGTHNPQKRDFLFDLVTKLKKEGVPIDGVGHQTHINISGPSIRQISDSIRKFGEAGFDNQITELDISVYTNNSTVYDPIPEDILIKQGYRYKELFEEFVRLDNMGKHADPSSQAYNPDGWISNVTLWGIADDHTWLHNRGTTRQDAPFPFDKRHQAKYAYWGMVEAVKELVPPKLPIVIETGTTAHGSPVIDGKADLVWSAVPAYETEKSGAFGASFKTLWDENNLYVRVSVQDSSNSAGDKLELFVNDGGIRGFEFLRNEANAAETEGGYMVEASIPVSTANTLGKQISFDVRVTNEGVQDGTEHGRNGAIVSWSDPRNMQHQDMNGYGKLTLIEAPKIAAAVYGTPVVDGELDAVWANANEQETGVWVEGTAGSTASFRTLWDEQYLYVYAKVADALLSDASVNPWEQDSVEIFVDQNNGKTAMYQGDDGQYRINFKNVKTVGGHAAQDNYESEVKAFDGGYVVEAAIRLDAIVPQDGTVIGFDLQVNNDEDGNGSRDSVAIWSDPTGQSYLNTSRLGILHFTSPPKPAAVEAKALNHQVIHLKWSEAEGAIGYNVYQAASANGPFVKITERPIEDPNYVINKLHSGTTYYYKVTAVHANGESSPTAAISATTKR